MAQPDWQAVARTVLLSRKLDELEVQQLTPQGKVKYQFSAGGHELAQALLAEALDHPHDGASVYYRSRPFMLANGLTSQEALTAGMALTDNPSQGRDVGVVYNLPRRQRATILPASGDVGAQYTPAAGWAQAICYRQTVLDEQGWLGALAVALGGDGSVAANGFWAALNIVTTLNLPYLFFIEDNAYGISVPSSLQTPGGDIAANLGSYRNLLVLQGHGWQPAAAWQVIHQAVAHIRAGRGPALLRMRVPRLHGHTFIDNQAYKPSELLEAEASMDPLPHLKTHLLESQLYDQQAWADLEKGVDQEIQTALAEAELTPPPAADVRDAQKFLFYAGIAPKQGGLRPEIEPLPLENRAAKTEGPRINFIEAVKRTLEVEMDANPRILVFGEDVGLKGGVHGATQDLQAHFGEARVFDTSLSEEGIIGRSVGMALAGLLPVPEIQFRKYADPAHEQISDLGTLRWRTANNFAAPLVVRIPVGYAKKTGDPWHSVSGEALYAHTLGWRIAYPSHAADAVGLMRTALRSDDPTFFFEHRALLDSVEGRRPYPGDAYCLPFGKAACLLEGDELVVITWGAMVPRCQAAAQQFKGRITLLDLRTIIPWDQEAVLDAVRQTGKVLVVHEDTYTAGFAGEIMAVISEQAFTDLDAPPARLTTPDMPIPFNVDVMNAIIPSERQIADKFEMLLAW
jgi:2-oxoisovalerate dehydrogenase E1 component